MFWTERKRVLITGFGPFGNIEENPSWEGVKSMCGREIENKYHITLFRKQIGVEYDEVDAIVPQLWKYYEPHLTIHVGLNEEVQSFVLEEKANKRDYTIRDIKGHLPNDFQNASSGPDVIFTDLDVERICKEFNGRRRKLRDPTLCAESSEDAQKYLCEYIYYTSLCRGHTLFVHVPLEKYSYKQIAYGLERILELCLKQLNEGEYTGGHTFCGMGAFGQFCLELMC